MRAYQRSINIHPTSSAYTNLGTCQFYLGHYADAVVYRNFEGVIGRYDDVPAQAHHCDRCAERESFSERGVAKLLNRTADRFEPTAVRDTPRGIKIKSKTRSAE